MGKTDLSQVLDLLGAGPVTAAQLSRQLGVSQPTVSRLLARAGDRVVVLGRGRATRYAAAERVFGAARVVPLFAVDGRGTVGQVGELRALAGGRYLVSVGRDPAHFWLRGAAGTGRFDALPYFLYDLRPAGFLGRQLARGLAPLWSVPADPRRWDDAHIGRYLLERGHDLPGSLVVGEAAAHQANTSTPAPIRSREVDYPALARAALAGDVPGSSAAGEQPKFLAYHNDVGHVIVKFSPENDNPEATRWQDLLRAEAHAAQVLPEHGVSAVRTTVFAFGGRVFLETARFDRPGPRGRRPAVSLGMVDAEFAGQGYGWTRTAGALHRAGMLSSDDLHRVAWLELFGTWIGNSDMHPGNLSLAPADGGFTLLPAYDMLPMALAPVRGEVPPVTLHPPIRTDHNTAAWDAARGAAHDCWQRLAHDPHLSDGFRRIARTHAARVGG